MDSEELEQIRAGLACTTPHQSQDSYVHELYATADRATRALRTVFELHHPTDLPDVRWGQVCVEDAQAWPCRTIRSLLVMP